MLKENAKMVFLGIMLVALLCGNSAYCAPTSTENTNHHTTLSTNNVHLPSSTMAPHSTELSKSPMEQANFNARLVISNSRANGSSVWGLTQTEAEDTCRKLAKQRSSMSDLISKMTAAGSPLSGLFRSIHDRFLNRFAHTQKFDYGSLFSIHNMGQLELLNSLFGRFFPAGVFWTGGQIVKKDGHYTLTWLDNAENHGSENNHPEAAELLDLSESEIEKLVGEKKTCLVLKKTETVRQFPFHFLPMGWSSTGHSTEQASTASPTGTTPTVSSTVASTVASSTEKKSINGLTWELHKCDDHLPYACLLHHASETSKTESTGAPTDSTIQSTASVTEHAPTDQATPTATHATQTFVSASTDEERMTDAVTHTPLTEAVSSSIEPKRTDMMSTQHNEKHLMTPNSQANEHTKMTTLSAEPVTSMHTFTTEMKPRHGTESMQRWTHQFEQKSVADQLYDPVSKYAHKPTALHEYNQYEKMFTNSHNNRISLDELAQLNDLRPAEFGQRLAELIKLFPTHDPSYTNVYKGQSDSLPSRDNRMNSAAYYGHHRAFLMRPRRHQMLHRKSFSKMNDEDRYNSELFNNKNEANIIQAASLVLPAPVTEKTLKDKGEEKKSDKLSPSRDTNLVVSGTNKPNITSIKPASSSSNAIAKVVEVKSKLSQKAHDIKSKIKRRLSGVLQKIKKRWSNIF